MFQTLFFFKSKTEKQKQGQPSRGWFFFSLRRFSFCSSLRISTDTKPAFPPESILWSWKTHKNIRWGLCCKLGFTRIPEQRRSLTWDWPGLRGGDRSPSESFPLLECFLGGDWSESDLCVVLERLRGGDWSESEASRFDCFFRGGDWSESESSLTLVLWAKGDRRSSGDLGLPCNDELGFLLVGEDSENQRECLHYIY